MRLALVMEEIRMPGAIYAVTVYLLMGGFGSVAQAADTDWQVEETPTETVYRLTDGDDSIEVTCTSERFGGGTTFDIVIDGVDPQAHATTEAWVGEKVHMLRHGMFGIGLTDCKKCSGNFAALWEDLKKPQIEEIRLKRGDRSVYLPARGGEEVLGKCSTDYDRDPPQES